MRNLTKDSRLTSRAYQFSKLIESGYLQETYKGVDFFTKDEGKYFTLKVFHGTAANHTEYINYRSAERRAEVIQNYKNNWDRRQDYKAEQKIKNKGKSSSHAGAAAAIKAELTALYPGIKFSCTSDSFSMGDSVHVKWTDGPTDEEVNNVIKKYQYGSFNGMEDIYEHTNSRNDIPQSKYVSGHRQQSDTAKALLPQFEAALNGYTSDDYHNSTERIFYRLFCNTSFPANYTGATIVKTDCRCGNMEDFYKIVFDTPEAAQQPEQPNFKPVEVTAGEVNIVDYSEKAIAVIGDTKPIKDKLKALGGSFNPRLSCGAGWIFPKKKLAEITAALSEETATTEPEQPQILALPEPEATEPETVILPTPSTNIFILDYFKILWHEGHQNPNFENTTFTTWEDVQTAFVKLWEVNERGSGGGYTKVKCEMKFLDQEIIITRIDITDRINNGDFNPSQMHIVTYLQSIADEDEAEAEPATPQHYNTLPEIQTAATTGKVISLLNLSELVNHV